LGWKETGNKMTDRVISKENAEHYSWGESCDGWHLVKSPELSIIQERVPAGGAEVRHLHLKAQQFFYVLSGTASLEVDGVELRLTPSQGRQVPAGVPHELANNGSEDLEFIVVSMPMAHGDRVLSPKKAQQSAPVDAEAAAQPRRD
jgi:mannose-6-phosphate isomerase-like protein (cupin superfamily)